MIKDSSMRLVKFKESFTLRLGKYSEFFRNNTKEKNSTAIGKSKFPEEKKAVNSGPNRRSLITSFQYCTN